VRENEQIENSRERNKNLDREQQWITVTPLILLPFFATEEVQV